MSTFRLHARIDELPAGQWDRLGGDAQPFTSHAFLEGLESTGCLRAGWGWAARHAALWDGDELLAAAPGYLKTNSHGEFVFDHAWAHAYERHGRDYFPKWLVAVPYTPVTGPRLLARDERARTQLVAAMVEDAANRGLSSLHVNFCLPREAEALDATWLSRSDVQFHWRRDPAWRNFDDFLAALDRKKRKNILAERRKVREAGVILRVAHGDEVSDDDLAMLHALYCLAFSEKGNSPALTLDFFRHLARTMPRSLVLVLAQRDGELIAGAVCLRSANTLYGRYWGCREDVPGLHFEACYYQGIGYCIEHGLDVFEPGAQGEHKVARGFLPTLTRSRHWVGDDAFRAALGPWCGEESRHAERYAAMILEQHNPYRDAAALAAR